MHTLLTAHVAITWMIVGLIWVIQIIVYPQFLRVGAAEFRIYHFSHCLRIGLMIGPMFLTELGTAAWLFYEGLRSTPFLISLAMFPIICLSTAIWQAPMHTRLANGRDDAVIRRLVLTNWVRTLAWSARGICLCFIV
jgi:hypothetical protein